MSGGCARAAAGSTAGDGRLLNWIVDVRLVCLIAVLTAPPLRLPGAVGSPATPIATV